MEGVMANVEDLVYGYLLDGEGGGTKVDWPTIDTWNPTQGILWLHLNVSSDEVMFWLMNKSGLSSLTCESLLDEATRPRISYSNDGLLVILRSINCNPDADPEDMVAVRMVITESRIISMRYRRIMATQDVKEDIESGKGPCSSGEFLMLLTDRIADRMGDVVAEFDDKVDDIEDTVLSADSEELRTQLSTLRRTSVKLRRYIAPQRDALIRLLNERIPWLLEAERAHLKEAAERTARFVEDIDSIRERAAVTQEELNHRLAERMNKAMYVLSIIAAIFLPLGFLTGLLGINVGGIPGSEYKWAFFIVTIILVAIAIALLTLFKKIKWL
jgi:zinc transporter